MLKLLLMLIFGYHSSNISLMWSMDGRCHRLIEKYDTKVKGSEEAWSVELGKPIDQSNVFYEKRHELSTGEFLIWYWALKAEAKRSKQFRLMQHSIKYM